MILTKGILLQQLCTELSVPNDVINLLCGFHWSVYSPLQKIAEPYSCVSSAERMKIIMFMKGLNICSPIFLISSITHYKIAKKMEWFGYRCGINIPEERFCCPYETIIVNGTSFIISEPCKKCNIGFRELFTIVLWYSSTTPR